MTTAKLYEIAEARTILDEWLAESEGEMTPEIEALLAEVNASADEKIERVALFIRERLAMAKAVEIEIERLQAIAKRDLRAADSLKDYLAREMERLGKDKVNGLLATIAFQNNPPSVQCGLVPDVLRAAFNNEAGAPEGVGQFVVEVPASYRLDKDTVKKAAKAGDPLPPEITITQTRSLRIR